MAIIVGITIRLFFVISWMIIHLGRNPDRGGSPPIDRSMVVIRVARSGMVFHVCVSARVVVDDCGMSRRNIEVVVSK